MREVIERLKSTDASAFALACWRWWAAEMGGMVPPGVRNRFRRPRARIVVDIGKDTIAIWRTGGMETGEAVQIDRGRAGESVADLLRAELGSGKSVDILVRLPVDEMLCRRLRLPAAAKRKIRPILAMELERQSPLPPEQVYHDHVMITEGRRSKTIDVDLRLVRRVAIDDARQLCRAVGLTHPTIGFFGPACGDVPPFADRGRGGRPRLPRQHMISVATAAVICALSLATAVTEGVRRDRDWESLQAAVQEARGQAQAVERLRTEVGIARERSEFLGRQKRSLIVSQILTEITDLLPDGTWLFQLELNGTEVRIRGYSPASSALIALFDESGGFSNARFRSPVTPGPRGDLERFDLSADYRGGGK